jgi:hypothetical protein
MSISLLESDFKKVVLMSKFYISENEKQYFISFLNDKIKILQKSFQDVILGDDIIYPKEVFYQGFNNDKIKNISNINHNKYFLLDSKRKTYSFFIKNIST